MNTREYANGNYYQDEKGNIEKLDTFEINYGVLEYPLNLKPIQLTEEILVNWCGAKETESYTYELTQIGKDIDLCIKFCEYDICVTIWQGDPIYLRYDFVDFHLHTLQNLCHSLTGEELTIKN